MGKKFIFTENYENELSIEIINSNQCTHGEYTNKFFGKECKPCGSPQTVICDIKAGGRKSHSSKECNGNGCKFKEL